MKKAYTLAAVMLLIAAGACADQQGISNPRTTDISGGEGVSTGGGVIAPQPTGKILLADGSSRVLQTNGTSTVCRAGGC